MEMEFFTSAISATATAVSNAATAVAGAAIAVENAAAAVSGSVAAISGTVEIISSTVADAAIKLSAVSTIGLATCAAAASIRLGFVTVNNYKEKTIKETLLNTGFKKIEYLEVTNSIARISGGILSLGLTECFGTHYRVYKTEICDAAGKFLGSTVPQAIETLRKLGEKCFKEGDYHRAKEYFSAALDNCPNELKDIKRTIQESLDNTNSRIHYKKGLDLWYAGNFTEAVTALKKATDLCSDEHEKSELLKTYNNVKAEECYQRGQQIISSLNTSGGTEYSNAKDCFDEAIRICSDDYPGRRRFEVSRSSAAANIERIRNVEMAEGYFMEGEKLWKNACDSENDGEVAEAKSLYHDANRKFEEALGIANNIAKYRKWADVCNNKIEGNKLYNQMRDVIREGNDCFNQGQYRNAKTKFRSAHELCVNAQQKFTTIDYILQNQTSAEWLQCVEAFEKPLLNVVSTVSLHLPSEKRREICSPSVEMQSNGVPTFTISN